MNHWFGKIYLGSHVTHVANAYNKDVWVKVIADAQYVTKREVSISDGKAMTISNNEEYVWKFAQKNGFTKVAPRTFLQFKPEYKNGGAYVTAFSDDGWIADGFRVEDNHSVIIDAKGCIKNTLMGTIWTDVSEKRHQ